MHSMAFQDGDSCISSISIGLDLIEETSQPINFGLLYCSVWVSPFNFFCNRIHLFLFEAELQTMT